MSSVGVIIKHPFIDPALVTAQLRIEPFLAQKSGAPIITPAGVATGSRYAWSTWSIFNDDNGGGLTDRVDDLVKQFRDGAEVLARIVTEGGKVSLTIRFEGDDHEWCELQPALMAELCRLSMTLGLEGFP